MNVSIDNVMKNIKDELMLRGVSCSEEVIWDKMTQIDKVSFLDLDFITPLGKITTVYSLAYEYFNKIDPAGLTCHTYKSLCKAYGVQV